MAKIRRSDEELPLSPPVFYVLLAVADHERHGYAIMQEVEKRTEGKVQLLPGSLYSTLKRMVAGSLIEECDGAGAGQSDDERRRYYRMTPFGREVAKCEARRIERLADMVRGKEFLSGAP